MLRVIHQEDFHKNIDEIYIVIHHQYFFEMMEIIRKNNWKKIKKVLKML